MSRKVSRQRLLAPEQCGNGLSFEAMLLHCRTGDLVSKDSTVGILCERNVE
jgi:hypothetical protein